MPISTSPGQIQSAVDTSTMWIFSSAENFLRVRLRISFTCFSADCCGPEFYLIFAPRMGCDGPEFLR